MNTSEYNFSVSNLSYLDCLYWIAGRRTANQWVCILFSPFLMFIIFLHSFYLFNWRLITLQYYSGFCHALTWISHGYTCVPHPEPLFHLPPYPIPQQVNVRLTGHNIVNSNIVLKSDSVHIFLNMFVLLFCEEIILVKPDILLFEK